MPKRLNIADHLSMEQLQQRERASSRVVEHKQWQVIRRLAQGVPSQQVASTLGYSVEWERVLARRYNRDNQDGPRALGDKRTAQPGPARRLDAAGQAELCQALQGEVPPALGGGLWNGPQVAAWISTRLKDLEHPLSARSGNRYLHHLGYSCQPPRPRPSQADPEEQQAFKKPSPKK
jgi:transposase